MLSRRSVGFVWSAAAMIGLTCQTLGYSQVEDQGHQIEQRPQIEIVAQDDLEAIQKVLERKESVHHLAESDQHSHWEIAFYRGDAKRFNSFLSALAAAAPVGRLRMVIHDLSGQAQLEKTRRAVARLQNVRWGKVASNKQHAFSMASLHNPPTIIRGEPFAFDWVVDVRQSFGPGVVPSEHAGPRLTLHLFPGQGVQLSEVSVPDNVILEPGGEIGNFIRRVEDERTYGRDFLQSIRSKP